MNNRAKVLATIVVTCCLVVATILDTNYAFAQSCSLDITQPELHSLHSSLDSPTAGDYLVVATLAKNNCVEDQPFVNIVEVRNSDGVTERLGWQTGVVKAPAGATQIGISWVPRAGGDYELRTFVISGFDDPQILSPIMTSTVTIEDDKLNRALVFIPYDPDPSLQQITFEPSIIKVILGVNNTVRWVSEDAVIHRLVGDFSNPIDFERPIFIYLDSPFEHTFTEAGEFQYVDRDREWMRGIVLVLPNDTVTR